MLTFADLQHVYHAQLWNQRNDTNLDDPLVQLAWDLLFENKRLWDLEDAARLTSLGAEHVSDAKQEIDKANGNRNRLIHQIDIQISRSFGNKIRKENAEYYSETPGMITDRLFILLLKLDQIKNIYERTSDQDIRDDYRSNSLEARKQISRLGDFFDRYLNRLQEGVVFFEPQHPLKIYNDDRVKGLQL